VSEEPKTIIVCAIVGPAEHLKRAWREFANEWAAEAEDGERRWYTAFDNPLWYDIQNSDEYKAMEIAVKMIVGEENE
jgi:hypothetical protein